MPPFSFVVPVINKPQLATDFIANLSTTQKYGEWQITFIDNGSEAPTRGVLQMLERHYAPYVKVITNEHNEGFGPANNQGAALLTEPGIVIFTQTDVTFHGDVLSPLGHIAHGTFYGPRLLTSDTGWNTFAGQVIPYLEGWFLACTTDTWQRGPKFDPIYVPADFEDVDLSYAATQQGMALVELPLPVQHNHSGAAGWSQFQGREQVTIAHRALFARKWNLPV